MSKPLFEQLATPSLDQAKATYAQRGGEYGDTWREKNPLALKAVMAKFGLPIPSEDVLSAMIAAALVDIKYSRLLGGYKEDSLIDGITYSALLVGAVKRAELDSQTKEFGCPAEATTADKLREGMANLGYKEAKRGEPPINPGMTYFSHNAGRVDGGKCICDICEVYRTNNP